LAYSNGNCRVVGVGLEASKNLVSFDRLEKAFKETGFSGAKSDVFNYLNKY